MESTEFSSERSPPTPELEGGSPSPPLLQQETRTPSESSSQTSPPPPQLVVQGDSPLPPGLQQEIRPPSEFSSELPPPTPELEGGSLPSPLVQQKCLPPSESSLQTSPSSPELVIQGSSPLPLGLQQEACTPSESTSHVSSPSLALIQGGSPLPPDLQQEAEPPSESSSPLGQGGSSPYPRLQQEAEPPTESSSQLGQGGSPPSPRLQQKDRPPTESSSQLSPPSLEPGQSSSPPSPRLQRVTGSCSPRLQRGSAPPSPRLPRGVVPPVPPETYRWEDVRRQRAMGGYPWSHLDKPPLGSKENLDDHEYEVINPPPPRVDVDPPSDEKKSGVDETAPGKRLDSETSSLGSGDPNFVHIPLHRDVDTSKDVSAQELQERMEERFFAATPETTASRTDCDVNTSQLDSSGLEDLPLQRGSRKKKIEDRESEARGLQQRIRSQAGRIRAKLRSMKMPERPKFNLPDRPKFNMPERPKFNLPERPKFNLPERPKFNLPERPKFKFPERPKFNMPQRPKISMPSMPSFSTSSKERPPKKTSSTRRPLRDRAANPSTESNASSSRKNFFDFDFKTYPRIFDRSRRKGDYATSSPKSTPRSQTPPPSMESTKPTMPSRKKGPVGSRWVHRFTDIKYVDDEDRQVDDPDEARYRRDRDSPDFRIIKLRDSTEEEKDDEEIRRDKIRYENEVRDAVEELDRQRQERESVHTESTTAFRDKDYDYAVGLTLAETNAQRNVSIPESNQEERSSGSSSDRHRAGVLEEIDSDEFFLRQKGISQEDEDVGRYLTSEIREAFRPPTNTLSQMDEKYFYDEEEQEEDADNLGNQYRGTPEREPVPPARTRSLRKRGNRAPPVVEEEDGSSNFNTFPPARPKRNRRQQEEEEEAQRLKDEEALEDELEEVSPPYIPTESQDMSYEEQDDEDAQPQRRRMDDDWQDEDKPQFEVTPPMAPRRVRRSRHDTQQVQKSTSREYVPEGQRNGHYIQDDWKENVEPNIMTQEVVALRMEHEYIVPGESQSSPVAPKRERRRTTSRGASTHSLAEGRTSRGAGSMRQEDDQEENMVAKDECEGQQMQSEHFRDESVAEESSRIELEQQQVEERVETQQTPQEVDLGEIGGYAIVEKIYPVKPPRPNRPKPPRPPAPTRRKRFNHFFSLPRKNNHAPPTRPLRNYSTLGPSRPSRRDRARKSESYVEIESDLSPSANEESHREDLKSGDVIERMKGRPLPAPPRPPRKTREAQDEDGEADVTESVEPTIPQPDTSDHALGALNDAVFYSTKEIIVPTAKEISTVTQSTKPEATVSNQEEIKTSNEEAPPRLKPEEILSSQVTETSVIEDREAFLVPDNLAVESEPFEEVTVATQTDPLPDDFCMEVEDEEPPEHADACTETIELEPEVPIPAASVESDTKTIVIEEPVNVQLEQVVQQAPEPVYVRPATPPPPPPPTIIERQVPVYIMPDKDTVIELRAERLQVSDLDVERLNVGELQAQKIFVSDIDGVSMQVAELSSKSGRLVINGIELPSGFLQELYDSFPRPSPIPPPVPSIPQSEPVSQIPVTQSESVSQPLPSQPPAQNEPPTISAPPPTPLSSLPPESIPPSVPPLPLHIPMDPAYSYIPSAMRVRRSQIQDMDSEEELISFVPSSHRRRRHHVPKPAPRYSTDEEEESVSFQPRRHPQRGDPTVVELGRQLAQAVTTTSMRAVRSLIQYTTTQLEGEDKRRELQTVLCILLILVAGLILMGFGTGKTFHHHHWDYLSPPQ